MLAAIRTAPVPFAATLSLIVAATGCSDDDPQNRRPVVEIQSGPMEGDEVSYRIGLRWMGADPDGRVEYYRYAIDPPAAFTELEIAGVTPGPTETFIPGGPNQPDRTRVSKNAGGEVVSFDWIHTFDTGKECTFATPNADSTVVDSLLVPLPRYSGTHAFYVEAVDDGGAISLPDRVGFTATSRTPITVLEFPRATDEVLFLGPVLPLEFGGLDPDGPAEGLPAAYLTKLVRLADLDPPKNLLGATDPADIVYRRAAHVPWVRHEADEVELPLEPGQYVFAVRAVDEAGAVDPFVGYGRPGEASNAIRFQAMSRAPAPEVTVSEPLLGTFLVTNEDPVRLETTAGQELDFTIHAGDSVDTCRTGLDLDDTDVLEDYDAVCTEFPCRIPPFTLEPGIHVFYIRCTDRLGSGIVFSIVLNALDLAMDRPLLIVDDYKDQTWPRDAEHDAFWTGLVQRSGRFSEAAQRPETLMFHSHGQNDVFFDFPVSPDLADLGRYRTIVYSTHGAGYNGRCGLTMAGPLRRHLNLYLGAGGRLWITGAYTAGAMIPNEAGGSSLTYPLEVPPESFAYRFMKIRAEEVHNDKNAANEVNGLVAVRPYPGQPEILPGMTVDTAKQNPILRGEYGIGAVDVILDPLLEGPGFAGTIDSLYAFGAIGPGKEPPRGSPYEGGLCAIRWHDPDPAREHGRTMWFGFPMYWFHDAEAQETFNRAVDWFREEQAP